jgi:hypothetical protein
MRCRKSFGLRATRAALASAVVSVAGFSVAPASAQGIVSWLAHASGAWTDPTN